MRVPRSGKRSLLLPLRLRLREDFDRSVEVSARSPLVGGESRRTFPRSALGTTASAASAANAASNSRKRRAARVRAPCPLVFQVLSLENDEGGPASLARRCSTNRGSFGTPVDRTDRRDSRKTRTKETGEDSFRRAPRRKIAAISARFARDTLARVSTEKRRRPSPDERYV